MIDLHLHLDGSLTPSMVIALAKMNNTILPADDESELKKYLSVGPSCKNLNEYLEKFDLPVAVLQTEEQLEYAVKALLDLLKSEGLIYAEIRFAPQLHTRQGLNQETVVKAAIRGLKASSLKANLILCAMRGNGNEKENEETLFLVKKYLNQGVVALDLAGAEAIWPNNNYRSLFEKAREFNVPFTIHSGEALGAKSVKLAIEYGASRIGHGIRAIEDPEVMKLLLEKKIPLECCPKSNFDTKVVEKPEDYPLKKLYEAGLILTINTDDRTVSDTTLANEYRILKNQLGFTEQDIDKMLENSVHSAFLPENDKLLLEEKIKEIKSKKKSLC